MYKNKVLFIDFDNTLTHNSKYPITGKLNKSVVEYVKELSKSNTLILWTCRTGNELKEAVKLCETTGIHFQGYNEYNGVEYVKPKYDLLIDDKNIRTSNIFKLKCFIFYIFKQFNDLLNQITPTNILHY